MKKILLTLIACLIAISVQAADTKIGYVDLNKALTESDEGKKALKNLEELFKARQAMIDEKQQEIKKLDEELNKQSSILNPDTLKAKREDREKMGRDYQRTVKDAEEELDKKKSDFSDRIIKDLVETTSAYGEANGYTIIFERVQSGIMYMPEQLNVTEQIIKKYNESKKADKK